MKRVRILVLIFALIMLCGCDNKFQGTWCKYNDVATTLVILTNDISDNQIKEITNYINKIENLKSYDIIDKIEDASKMITIYYKNDDNILEYEKMIKTFTGIDSVKSTKVNEVVDKLVVKKEDYTLGRSLNNLTANEMSGKYKIENDELLLDDGVKFYYKNKYLCYDEYCNSVLTKSKTNDCG